MSGSLRWGAPVYGWQDPDTWVGRHRELGLRAAYWPDVAAADRAGFVAAAQKADLSIAEVGAWSNPLAKDPVERQKAVAYCVERLALADEVGARCCVNIAGSLADQWDGPCAENLSETTFDQIVETTREIIDTVAPRRSYFTLEIMPWVWPWDADSYLALLRAIDRERFAVHLDPANAMSSPRLCLASTQVYRELFAKLGPWIQSCHVKDLALRTGFPAHIEEVPLLSGCLDLPEFVRLTRDLDLEIPMMLEHLPDEGAYQTAVLGLQKAGLF